LFENEPTDVVLVPRLRSGFGSSVVFQRVLLQRSEATTMHFSATIRSFCVLFGFFTLTPLLAQDQDWGKKMLDKREVKFGSVAKNAEVTFKFTLKNIYQESIQVSGLSTSCGCKASRKSSPFAWTRCGIRGISG
jgi:Protein of unknown function (DUF1573)